MRMKRLLTGLLSAALLGATPIALAAAPAQAATVNTWIEGKISSKKIEKGRTVWISGNVHASAGYPDGTVVIDRTIGNKTTRVYTDTSPGYFSYSFKAQRNATFQIRFLGGSDYSNTYLASSASTKLKVMRKLNVKTSYTSLTVKGKVSPKFGNKKFTVKVKKGKKWKNWRKVKTNKKGKYSVRLNGSRGNGTKYRFIVPASKGFVKTKSGVITARIY